MHFIELEPKGELGELGKNDWTYEYYCKLYDQVYEQLKSILDNNGYRLQSSLVL